MSTTLFGEIFSKKKPTKNKQKPNQMWSQGKKKVIGIRGKLILQEKYFFPISRRSSVYIWNTASSWAPNKRRLLTNFRESNIGHQGDQEVGGGWNTCCTRKGWESWVSSAWILSRDFIAALQHFWASLLRRQSQVVMHDREGSIWIKGKKKIQHEIFKPK